MSVAPSHGLADRSPGTERPVTTRHARRVPGPPHTLRELRLQRGWSLNDLAQLCEIPKAIISQIERGRMVATAQEADRLAAVFGYPPGALQTKPMLFLIEAPR